MCGAYFFEFRGRNLVCFGIAYNFDGGGTGKFAPEAGKARMRTAFFTRVRRRAKSPLGTVLIINLLGKGLTPRACMGDGGSI